MSTNEQVVLEARVRQLRARRAVIVKNLPKALRIEYRRIRNQINSARLRIARIKLEAIIEEREREIEEVKRELAKRIPLHVHNANLIDFLKKNGPATRSQIAEQTNIPAGSLSLLLSQRDFTRKARGLWKLRGKRKPSTSPT